MIVISADLLKFNVVAFADLPRNLGDCERDFIGEQGFAVFDGKDDVVVRFIDIVMGTDDGHAAILYWKPRVSKPSYMVIAAEPRGNPLRVINYPAAELRGMLGYSIP